MDRYLDDIRKDSRLRKQRLKRIKDLVMRGEYRVDPSKVAVKLIEDGLEHPSF